MHVWILWQIEKSASEHFRGITWHCIRRRRSLLSKIASDSGSVVYRVFKIEAEKPLRDNKSWNKWRPPKLKKKCHRKFYVNIQHFLRININPDWDIISNIQTAFCIHLTVIKNTIQFLYHRLVSQNYNIHTCEQQYILLTFLILKWNVYGVNHFEDILF